jgi:outer membrane protein
MNKLKKILFLILFTLLTGQVTFAQKFGYVDSEFVMSKMPAYTAAQKEVDKLSENWQKDIENRFKEVEKLHKTYLAEEVLLTEEMKKKRQNEIAEKEKEAKDYQKKIFGFEGQLFRKRQELVRPVLDELSEAIDKVAKQRQLQFVFGKSDGLVILHMNPTHDYTDYVLEALGLASPDKNTPAANRPVVDPNDTPAAQTPSDMGNDAENEVSPAAKRTTPAKTQPNKKQPKKK